MSQGGPSQTSGSSGAAGYLQQGDGAPQVEDEAEDREVGRGGAGQERRVLAGLQLSHHHLRLHELGEQHKAGAPHHVPLWLHGWPDAEPPSEVSSSA